MEGVLDDEADYLRREVGEMRGERCGEGVELVALVAAEAARGDHFLDVRVGRLRGGRGAGAEEDRYEQSLCPRQQNQGASGPGRLGDYFSGNGVINARSGKRVSPSRPSNLVGARGFCARQAP